MKAIRDVHISVLDLRRDRKSTMVYIHGLLRGWLVFKSKTSSKAQPTIRRISVEIETATLRLSLSKIISFKEGKIWQNCTSHCVHVALSSP